MIHTLLDLVINNNTKLGLTDVALIKRVKKLSKLCIPFNISSQMIEDRIQTIELYKRQLNNLFKVPQFTQRTPEWYNERHKMISSSDFATAIGDGKFSSQKDFIIKKCSPLTTTSTFDANHEILSWGIKYEPIATNIYGKRNNVVIHEFGLIKHQNPQYNYIGASPDGITENGIMIEIKCPYRRTIDGSIPTQYYYQIQGQLEVCNLEEADYIECAFKEYYSKNDYFNDSDSTGKYTKDMNEKGIIYEYQDGTNTRHYVYSPFLCNNEDLIKWIDETEKNLNNIDYKVKFWYIKEYHCKRVYRDRQLFEDLIKKVKIVWEKILEYRNDKDLYKNEVLTKRKKTIVEFEKERKTKELILNGFSFLKDDG